MEFCKQLPIGGLPATLHVNHDGRSCALGLASAVAWAVAIWVSAYEPLVLFLIVTATALVMNRRAVFARDRRAGWILFAAIIAIAFAIERRVPSFAIFQSNGHFEKLGEHHRRTRARFTDESSLVELVRISAVGRTGLDLDEHENAERRRAPDGRALPIYVLLVATYFLTVWQARWGYFFVLIFALALPALLAPIKSSARGLDRIRVVDVSDFARLGRTALAKRSAIG